MTIKQFFDSKLVMLFAIWNLTTFTLAVIILASCVGKMLLDFGTASILIAEKTKIEVKN